MLAVESHPQIALDLRINSYLDAEWLALLHLEKNKRRALDEAWSSNTCCALVCQFRVCLHGCWKVEKGRHRSPRILSASILAFHEQISMWEKHCPGRDWSIHHQFPAFFGPESVTLQSVDGKIPIGKVPTFDRCM